MNNRFHNEKKCSNVVRLAWFLSVAFLLIVGSAYKAQSQTVVDFETNALPNGWSFAGSVSISNDTSREPGKYSVRLLGKNAYLQTSQLSDIAVLSFWVRVPQSTDNLTVVVETSQDAKTWIPRLTFDQNGSATAPSDDKPKVFSAKVQQLNISGTFYLRFRIDRYTSGAIFLDDIKIEPLLQEDKDRIKKEAEDTDRRNAVQIAALEVVKNQSYDEAKNTFKDVGSVYNNQLETLANLDNNIGGIDLLTTTATAVAGRNEMANPMAYSAFANIAASLKKVLPPVKKSRLDDILAGFGKVVNVGFSVVRFFTGFSLQGLVDNFKNLLADGYSPQNLDYIKKVKDLKKDAEDAEKNGPLLYEQTKTFLDATISEYERVNQLNVQMDKLQVEATQLRQETDSVLLEYLTFIGAKTGTDRVQAIRKRQSATMIDVKNEIDTYIEKTLGARDEYTSLTTQQRLALREMEAKFRQIGELNKRYETLTSGILEYYQNFLQDVSRKENPFQAADATTRKQWEDQRNTVKGLVEPLASKFKSQYIGGN